MFDLKKTSSDSRAQELKLRRVLLSVSDKTGIVELAKAMDRAGVELVATGRTAKVLQDAGLKITPIEKVSGSPEAFQGRMKTLSFPVCSGILYRRGDSADEKDLESLKIQPIDGVVVNFYPFESAAAKTGITKKDLIEEVDIGGPTLVRAAAKNAPDVLVLTSPDQYSDVIHELNTNQAIRFSTVENCAAAAWERVLSYDSAIARNLGGRGRRDLRYGENPHQKGFLEFDPAGPIAWDQTLTPVELSYNNILDLSAAYALASDLIEISPNSTSVVIVKHNNPCGVSSVPKNTPHAQKLALTRAWDGDPVSAFGGVLIFTDPIEEEAASWLSQHFVELVAAPGLQSNSPALRVLAEKRKKLKALAIRRFGEIPPETLVAVPGGRLYQTSDTGNSEELKSVTRNSWPENKKVLAKFGIAVCRALKSNAIALVREIHTVPGAFQLVGAGQGQPNRVEALKCLAVPRAQSVLRASEGTLDECVMVSDAFFPFRDTVDTAHAAGIRAIVQPGGSLKDAESIAACDENGMTMVFTGTRHFRP
ncbi:MAG: bifunctional phosphoribosylaminoimidazolecarboxamide formyltransferase/IMP cyclohydrolase [Bdellovibrio sp.]|nr:bifunctional phosphoribosylaminoimidazolecarboxamide formyltransferase/IMP cyclohydrolase [Bdellovibrio sp.]